MSIIRTREQNEKRVPTTQFEKNRLNGLKWEKEE